jgi:hypothetical protein
MRLRDACKETREGGFFGPLPPDLVECIDTLVREAERIDFMVKKFGSLEIALCIAVKLGGLKDAERCRQAGADVSALNQALCGSFKRGSVKKVARLLAAGADVNAMSAGTLHKAWLFEDTTRDALLALVKHRRETRKRPTASVADAVFGGDSDYSE